MTSLPHHVTLGARRRLCRAEWGGRGSRAASRHFQGAFGQPFEGSTRDNVAPASNAEQSTSFFASIRLRFEPKGDVRRRADAGGVEWMMVDRIVGDVWRDDFACRDRGTRVRGYPWTMAAELSSYSVVDSKTWFSLTQWERVPSRRASTKRQRRGFAVTSAGGGHIF